MHSPLHAVSDNLLSGILELVHYDFLERCGQDVANLFMGSVCDVPCRFLHDIAFGMSIVARGLRTNTDLLDDDTAAQPAAEPSSSKGQSPSGPKPQPLQLLLHVSNLSVLLPASSK